MSFSDALRNLVTIELNTQPPIAPGDFVCIDPGFCVNGDIPLTDRTIEQALEREAFTGKADNKVTGWIRKKQIALVVGVIADEVYLWAREGRGWIKNDAVCRIQDIPDPGDSGN